MTHPLPLQLTALGAGGGSPTVSLLDAAACHPVGSFADRGGQLSVYAVALSPAGDRLVAGTRRVPVRAGPEVAFVRAWSLPGGALAWEHALVGRGASDLVALADGGAAVGCDDGSVVVLRDAGRGGARVVAEARPHRGAVLALRALGPGALLSLGADGALVTLDVTTLAVDGRLATEVGADRARYVVGLGLDPETGAAFHGDVGGRIHRIDLRSGEHRTAAIDAVPVLAVDVDPSTGRVIAGASDTGVVRVLDGETLEVLGELALFEKIVALGVRADGTVAVAHPASGVQLLRQDPAPAAVGRVAAKGVRALACVPPAPAPRRPRVAPAAAQEATFFGLVDRLAQGEEGVLDELADALLGLAPEGDPRYLYHATFVDRATGNDGLEATRWETLARLVPEPWPEAWASRRAAHLELVGMVPEALATTWAIGTAEARARAAEIAEHPAARVERGERARVAALDRRLLERARAWAARGRVDDELVRVWSEAPAALGPVDEPTLRELLDEHLAEAGPGGRVLAGPLLQYAEDGRTRSCRAVRAALRGQEPRWLDAVQIGFFLEDGGAGPRTVVAPVLDLSWAFGDDVEAALAAVATLVAAAPETTRRLEALLRTGRNLAQAALRRGV